MCGQRYGGKKLLISDHDRAMCEKTFCFDGGRSFLQGISSKNTESQEKVFPSTKLSLAIPGLNSSKFWN